MSHQALLHDHTEGKWWTNTHDGEEHLKGPDLVEYLDFLPGPPRHTQLRLRAPVKVGFYSTIYSTHHATPDASVVKLYRSLPGQCHWARFLKEARVLTFLQSGDSAQRASSISTNLFKGIGTTPDGMPFLVLSRHETPLCDLKMPGSLRDQHTPLPVENQSQRAAEAQVDAAYVILDVFRTLRAVHASGLYHGDVRASNILVDLPSTDSDPTAIPPRPRGVLVDWNSAQPWTDTARDGLNSALPCHGMYSEFLDQEEAQSESTQCGQFAPVIPTSSRGCQSDYVALGWVLASAVLGMPINASTRKVMRREMESLSRGAYEDLLCAFQWLIDSTRDHANLTDERLDAIEGALGHATDVPFCQLVGPVSSSELAV